MQQPASENAACCERRCSVLRRAILLPAKAFAAVCVETPVWRALPLVLQAVSSCVYPEEDKEQDGEAP